MLTRIYVEALLVDADLADQVWELWYARLVSDDLAAVAWWLISAEPRPEERGNHGAHYEHRPIDSAFPPARSFFAVA